MANQIRSLFGITLGHNPKRVGSQAITWSSDLTANTPLKVDLQQEITKRKLSTVQTIYVDNRNNAGSLSVDVDGTGQNVTIGAGGQAYIPILVAGSNEEFGEEKSANGLVVTLTSTADYTPKIFFLNVFVPPTVFYMLGNAVVTVSGDVKVKPTPAATSPETNVALTGADQSVLAANANRLPGSSIYNDPNGGSSIAYIKLGSTAASLTSFTVALVPGAYYELPDNYVGAVRCISAAALGNLRVTELSA